MPEYPERLLSDNIPCLRKDRKEDGAFAGCLSFLIFLFQCFAAGRDVPEQVRPRLSKKSAEGQTFSYI